MNIKQGQPLDNRFLAWDRHVNYIAKLNMFVSAQPSLILGKWENKTTIRT